MAAMKIKSLALHVHAAILIGISASCPAHAQDATAEAGEPAAQKNEEGGRVAELGTVQVTAEKRSGNLQKTAIAISVIDSQQLQDEHKKNVSDVVVATPGLQVSESANGQQFSIRGVTATGRPGGEQSVPTYRDGVYADRIYAARSALLDVDRVEVLKGPQGTLFGRNALGGAINISYKQPELQVTEGYVGLGVGNYSLREADAAFNLPVGETAALRAAISSGDRDGYLNNGRQDDESRAARIKFRWKPNEDVDLVFLHEQNRTGGLGLGYSDLPAAWPDRSGWDPWYDDDTSRTTSTRTKTSLSSLNLTWDTPIGTVNFLPAHLESDYLGKIWQGFNGVMKREFAQDSLELRLLSKVDSRVQWQVGAYYYDSSEPMYFWSAEVEPDAENTDSTPVNGTLSKALFGEATIPLAGGWSLITGMRYTRDRRRFENSPMNSLDESQETFYFSKSTYNLGVKWDLSPQAMLYAKYSTGYRAGDIEASTAGISSGKAQVLTDYSFGLKSRFLDNRLQFNAEAYYYDYENYPITLNYVEPGGTFPAAYAATAEKLVIKGLDLDLLVNLGANDRISLGYSYMDGMFGDMPEFDDPAITDPDMLASYKLQYASYANSVKQQAPRNSFNLGYHHYVSFNDGSELDINPEVFHSSSYYASSLLEDMNDIRTLQPSYYLYNFYVNYTSASGKWGLGAYGKNLGNEAVVNNIGTGGSSADAAFVSAPRTYGVRCWFNF